MNIGNVELHYGTDGLSANAPFLVGAENGYACLRISLDGFVEREPSESGLIDDVKRVVDKMRNSSDGMWLAFCKPQGSSGFAMVQTNRGPFYKANFGPGGRIWRDFYARSAYYALDYMTANWGPTEIEISHPCGWGWPADTAPAFLDGARRWILGHSDSGLRDLYFRSDEDDPCDMPGASTLQDAFLTLELEDSEWREVTVEAGTPAHFGIKGVSDEISMLKVDVSREED